jgi:transcriptional regulator with PAS, ATPase and Fis domain
VSRTAECIVFANHKGGTGKTTCCLSIVSQQLIQDRIRELRENTDYISTLLESLVGYAIIAADFDGDIIAFNEGACQIYGYALGEVIGKQDIEIFFSKDFIEAGKLQTIINDLIEKERFSYKWLSTPKTASTAQMLGLMHLKQSVPNLFSEMLQRYDDLMELALEQQVYRVEHDISGNLRSIAEELGYLKAGPRDVVELHSSALRKKTSETSHGKAQAYVEEGRVMVLELIGHLASYYSTYSLGAMTMKINDRPIEKGNDE